MPRSLTACNSRATWPRCLSLSSPMTTNWTGPRVLLGVMLVLLLWPVSRGVPRCYDPRLLYVNTPKCALTYLLRMCPPLFWLAMGPSPILPLSMTLTAHCLSAASPDFTRQVHLLYPSI